MKELLKEGWQNWLVVDIALLITGFLFLFKRPPKSPKH